jgi:hypothetical protein
VKKFLSCLLFSACAILMVSLVGCQVAPPGSTATVLTPEQQQARAESKVKLAAGLATKGVLIAIDEKDAVETAKVINQVASDIVQITANDSLDLTLVRTTAVQRIAGMKATVKQKLIAEQLVDAVILLVQDGVDQYVAAGGTKTVAGIRLTRAAAEGARDATMIFLPQ